MNRLGLRIERNLKEIVEHVTPSGSGWDQIRARTEEQPNESDQEVMMLEVDDRPSERGRRRAAFGLLGAAAALIVTIAAGSFVRSGDDETLASDTDPQVVVDRYIDAFNSGDVPGAIGLFAVDAFLTDGDGTSTMSPTLGQWESLLRWYAAQDARISDAGCETTATAEESATVRCQWVVHDAVTEAIDRRGDSVVTEWTIEAGRVVEFNRAIAWSVQPHASFSEWVSANHPDDYAAVVTFPFDLVPDEATQVGELFAEHTPEWADYYLNGPGGTEPIDD